MHAEKEIQHSKEKTREIWDINRQLEEELNSCKQDGVCKAEEVKRLSGSNKKLQEDLNTTRKHKNNTSQYTKDTAITTGREVSAETTPKPPSTERGTASYSEVTKGRAEASDGQNKVSSESRKEKNTSRTKRNTKVHESTSSEDGNYIKVISPHILSMMEVRAPFIHDARTYTLGEVAYQTGKVEHIL